MIKPIEQYSDYLARLFPITVKDPNDEQRYLARTVTFQVTDACNLRCKYCYQINKGKHSMSWETAKKFADFLLNTTPENCEYVNPVISPGIIIEFIGGEPFLEIDLIDKICDYLIQRMIEMNHPWATRFRFSICSNGVLYFDERVQRFFQKHLQHLSFSISIDGNKELHDSCRVFEDGSGSYDIAMKGVNHFVNVLKGHMGSKMTLAPANIDKTADAVKGLIESGYTEIFLNCVYEEGWNLHYATILYNQLKELSDYILDNDLFDKLYLSIFEEDFFGPKDETDNDNWCGGTGMMLSCDWKGLMYPCIRYMESSLGTEIPPIVIGDVDHGLLATEEQRHCVECMKNVTRRSQSTDECFYCPIAGGCSWCSAHNYQCFGTVDKRATFICVMHKARALANAYFWNKAHRMRGEPERFTIHIPKEWALEIISEDEWNMLNALAEP